MNSPESIDIVAKELKRLNITVEHQDAKVIVYHTVSGVEVVVHLANFQFLSPSGVIRELINKAYSDGYIAGKNHVRDEFHNLMSRDYDREEA